jgi:response regulator RpfG family c-di-GMP phosphodiesterase
MDQTAAKTTILVVDDEDDIVALMRDFLAATATARALASS